MSRNWGIVCLALVAVAALPGAASAALIMGTGPGVVVPDASGSTPGVVSTDIVIGAAGIVTDVTVDIPLFHRVAGNMTATLTHVETGTSVDLFNRIGFPGPKAFGDDSNFVAPTPTSVYSFNDAFAGDLWAVAGGLAGNQAIPNGQYAPTTAGGAASSLAAFNGEAAAGTWRLTLTDSIERFQAFDGDQGGPWKLTLNVASAPMPEPASLAVWSVLGAVGLIVGLRRRRNR